MCIPTEASLTFNDTICYTYLEIKQFSGLCVIYEINDIYYNDINKKTTKYSTVGTGAKLNRKYVEMDKVDTSNI